MAKTDDQLARERQARQHEQQQEQQEILSTVHNVISSIQSKEPGDGAKQDDCPISASVLTGDGIAYPLGELKPSDTVLSVKQKLGTLTHMLVAQQFLYLVDDTREGVDDLQLRNNELMSTVKDFSSLPTVLQFAVVIGQNDNAAEMVKSLPPSAHPEFKIGDKIAEIFSDRLHDPKGVAFIPAHSELLVTATHAHHQVRVYHRSGTLLCYIGRGLEKEGAEGTEKGEFSGPWGVAVTADSTHVVVSENYNHRLQLLKLEVTAGDGYIAGSARLEFVRFIGGKGGRGDGKPGSLIYPRGMALRLSEGRETVLVAEAGSTARVSEFELDGTFVKVYGLGEGCAAGQLDEPEDVAVIPSTGEVAVADSNNSRICIFDGESGSFVREFCLHDRTVIGSAAPLQSAAPPLAPGAPPQQEPPLLALSALCRPTAITADAYGNLLVMDRDSETLKVFDADGALVCVRSDLGIRAEGEAKGITWFAAEGCLAIANAGLHAVLVLQGE
jgi:hypothetical protein